MRKSFILFVVLALTACSKDGFNPSDPKNGQKAELFVDHYSDVRNQMIFLLPKREPSPLSLGGFEERELGYTYKVKAEVYISPQIVMDDGVNSWFEFKEVISKEKYPNTEPFEIGLVYSIGFGGSGGTLAIRKVGDQFKYGAGGVLRPADEQIHREIQEYLSIEREIGSYEELEEYQKHLQNLALKAVVTHDPENWGKGYLVHEIKSSETKL